MRRAFSAINGYQYEDAYKEQVKLPHSKGFVSAYYYFRRLFPLSNLNGKPMNEEKNKQIIRELYEEVFCGHNLSEVDRYFHDDYIQHDPNAAQGKAGFIEFHNAFFKAIPDVKTKINMMAAEGDIVFVYSTYTGTHAGDGLMGLSATGNKVHYDVIDIFRLRDGKLCEHWDVADTKTIFAQLGG
jgi:predicted SnoaL-like aldol condensation-catalyzing enzyme